MCTCLKYWGPTYPPVTYLIIDILTTSDINDVEHLNTMMLSDISNEVTHFSKHRRRHDIMTDISYIVFTQIIIKRANKKSMENDLFT